MPVTGVIRRFARFLRGPRPIESYNRLWLGATALAVLVVVLAALVGYSSLNVGRTRYQGEFAQAAQIKKGNQVTIAGIAVGTVDGVELAGNHVVVAFTVRDGIRLGAATRAAIKLTTILGARYLELSPADAGDLDRRTIPMAQTSVPYDLQKSLEGATSAFLPMDADRVVDAVKVLNEHLQGLPDALPPALDHLQSLAGIIGDRRDQLGALLTNANALTTMIRDQKADLGLMVLQGRDLLREIAGRRAAVEQLFTAATTLIDRAKTLLYDEPAIDKLLTDTNEFTKMMADRDALLRNILQVTPVTVRNFANATGSGQGIDLNPVSGIFVDSWMCALSGRAKQFDLVEYVKDCK